MADAKKTEEKTAAPSLDDIVMPKVKGEAVTGGFEGPTWCPDLNPELSDKKEKVLDEAFIKLSKGSTRRKDIAGVLRAAFAWGRRLYFIDVPVGGNNVRVLVREHAGLYQGLNLSTLDVPVSIVYQGKGKATMGRAAPHRYLVVSEKPVTKPREDALTIESMDEREARLTAANEAKKD